MSKRREALAAMDIMLTAETVCSEHGSVRDSGCGECIGAEAVEVFCATALEVMYADKPLEAVWYRAEPDTALHQTEREEAQA